MPVGMDSQERMYRTHVKFIYGSAKLDLADSDLTVVHRRTTNIDKCILIAYCR